MPEGSLVVTSATSKQCAGRASHSEDQRCRALPEARLQQVRKERVFRRRASCTPKPLAPSIACKCSILAPMGIARASISNAHVSNSALPLTCKASSISGVVIEPTCFVKVLAAVVAATMLRNSNARSHGRPACESAMMWEL